MGFREQLNRKPTFSAGVVFGLLALLAVWALVVRLTNRASLQAGGEIYFSTNDGKTWFANPAMNQPPFDYDGATAVRCYVFRVGDSASFVGYLETNTPQMYDLLTGVSHGPGAARRWNAGQKAWRWNLGAGDEPRRNEDYQRN